MKNKPINTHCPWSGKPVSDDSTIQYQGHTVAFCNPGCRDKFATATNMFDEAIKQSRKPVLKPTDVSEYQPRAMRFDSVMALGETRLKQYHIIVTADEPINAAIAEQADAFVREHLPEKIEISGGSHGVGFVIHHRGLEDHWLLMHWWGGGDISLSSMARLPKDATEFRSVDEEHLHACVWEQVVISHERDAWVRTMMTGTPEVAKYLADCLANGLY